MGDTADGRKPHYEYIEGKDAAANFEKAMQSIVSVSKEQLLELERQEHDEHEATG